MKLQEKGQKQGRLPHQLIMTATPIPRTLAMTAYADLDISVIDELPPGRTPIHTVVIPEQRRAEVVLRIVEACRAGRQAYWVCPLIDESDELRAQAAEETAASLSAALPGVRVGLVHGRMPGAAKDAAMLAFKAGKIQLLVATTVIEVGVDVPNATLMVIENAERMGLAQLHQLRGRVGRGTEASTCVLLYRAPLSQLARERLKVIRETTDGFEIARRDLELRGPGELLGHAPDRARAAARRGPDARRRPAAARAGERPSCCWAPTRRTSKRSRPAGSARTSATDASASTEKARGAGRPDAPRRTSLHWWRGGTRADIEHIAHFRHAQVRTMTNGYPASSLLRPPAPGPVNPGGQRVPRVRQEARFRQSTQ